MIVKLILLLIAMAIVKAEFDLEEDSGSIEIPDRPENRQAHRAAIKAANPDDRQTFIHLLSKLMNALKNTVQNTVDKIDSRSAYKAAIQKTRKSLHGLRKAYAYAEKAKKHFMKNMFT